MKQNHKLMPSISDLSTIVSAPAKVFGEVYRRVSLSYVPTDFEDQRGLTALSDALST